MKTKNIATICVCGLFILFLSLMCFFISTPKYSESERRALAEFPEVSTNRIISGEFSSEFEEYATDRFPMRDIWRSIKAYTSLKLLRNKDNNDIFLADGHISKLEYPMNKKMLDHSISLFRKIKEQYLSDNSVYFAVIPDKNKELAELKFDYREFEQYMTEGMDFAHTINIGHLLTADDYYYTDTHWRQDKITDVAKALAEGMGVTLNDEYEPVEADLPFYGVYAGQSAMKCEPDTITYLTNDTIEGLQVSGAKAVYDMDKASGKDPYEMFLSGNQPIVTLTNPSAENSKRLVIFRDSFASSIAPLLAEGYSEIVLVDLRYINSAMIGQFVDFKGADILFLYSTLLLNNSLSMK